jgi:hypothetical protein
MKKWKRWAFGLAGGCLLLVSVSTWREVSLLGVLALMGAILALAIAGKPAD